MSLRVSGKLTQVNKTWHKMYIPIQLLYKIRCLDEVATINNFDDRLVSQR